MELYPIIGLIQHLIYGEGWVDDWVGDTEVEWLGRFFYVVLQVLYSASDTNLGSMVLLQDDVAVEVRQPIE